jgi:hypothetical protein
MHGSASLRQAVMSSCQIVKTDLVTARLG